MNLLNTQSSHYESYAQTLQVEIDLIMETIKNMCANTTNPKTDTDISDKSKQIFNDLGLEDIPDYDQLLSESNNELVKGYELLNKLNIDKTDSSSDTETDTDQIINRVSKAKITRSKQNQQMIARTVIWNASLTIW